MLRVLAVATLAVLANVTSAAPLPDDPALAKPVTLAVKGEALSDVMGMMQEQTGVKLRVERDIADQKVTIFVDEKPLRDVMNGLVTVFGYRWSPETASGNRVYRLWEDENARRQREDLRQNAYSKAWEQADAIFDYMTQFSQLKADEIKQLVDKLTSEYAEKKDNETRLKLAAARNLSEDPRSRTIAEYYQTLPDSVQNAIKSGLTVHYDSASQEPEWKLPDDVSARIGEATKSKFVVAGIVRNADGSTRISEDQNDWKLDGVNLGYSAIITNESAGLDAAVYIRQKMTVSMPASGQSPPTTSVSETALSTTYSLARERAQQTDTTSVRRLPRKQDGALVKMKVSFDSADIVKETGMPVSSNGAPANRSDILAILHKKLGLQIISDHYSQWCTWTAEKIRNVEEFLPMFGQMYRAQHEMPSDVDWGWDGQYCYLRSRDASGCDQRETPNRLLRTWQAAYARNGYLGLDELGQISLLSDAQIAALRANVRHLGLGDEIVTSNLLRVYATLSASQRADAFGDDVSIARMTPEQRIMVGTIAFSSDGRWPLPGSRVIVGIYQNGLRIDKPERAEDNPDAPVTLKMSLTDEQTSEHYEVRADSGPGIRTIQAASPEEAWQKLQSESPNAKKTDLICIRRKSFAISLARAQGTSHSFSTSIPFRVPYSDLDKASADKAN